jgi:hypothetical protein
MVSETATAELSDTTKPRFEVEYGCNNCGGCWVYAYPEMTHVDAEDRDGVVTYDGSSFSGSSTVTCPICELSKAVVVNDRRPIEEGDG